MLFWARTTFSNKEGRNYLHPIPFLRWKRSGENTIDQNKESISNEDYCFHFQREVEKPYCMFWNFTIKYVKGVFFILCCPPYVEEGLHNFSDQLSSRSESHPVPLSHVATRKCYTGTRSPWFLHRCGNFIMMHVRVFSCKQPLRDTVVYKNGMRCPNITGPCILSLGLQLTAHGRQKDVHWWNITIMKPSVLAIIWPTLLFSCKLVNLKMRFVANK